MALATYQDVESRWRALTQDEQTKASTRIGDAEALLRTVIPDLDDRIAADSSGNLGKLVTSRIADAVIRFLRNPQGAKQLQETIGPRSYGLTFEGSSTGIFFTDDELAALRLGSGVAADTQAIGTAYLGTRPGWNPVPRHRWWA